MTTLAHRTTSPHPGRGGIAARRPLFRWAWRMFRREWRQQILVTALLSVAVAAAVGSITIAHNAVPADDGDFGSANQVLTFDGSDPRKLEAGLNAARESFGTIDVIGHRSVAVPGSVEPVDFRSQAPGGTYSDELLALRRGRYPVGLPEVAVTDGVAESLRLDIGSSLSLDGRRLAVVGIVENPRKLSDEFALVSRSPGSADHVDVLVSASLESASARSFFQSLDDGDPARLAFTGNTTRGSDVSSTAETLAIVSVATVFLLLASLVATAGFAVVAQRRLRQLGMLAAVGASAKQLRLVLLTNGAFIGTLSALIGTIAGLGLWVIFAPTLESAVDHRIDRLSLPWTLIATAVVLAVVGATAAAWWPGRAVARVPVTLALSARPPMPKPARRSALVAVVLIAAGIASLALSDRTSLPLIVAGILATILGTLLLGPLAIRVFARAAGHAPIVPRLALRDLARYQARSGAALAAITLALGIAAAIVVTATAEGKRRDERTAAALPNLSDRQIRIYTGRTGDPELIPVQIETPAQLARSAARVHQLAASLDLAAVIPLRKAVQSGRPPIVTVEGDRALVAVGLSRRNGPRSWIRESLYVATPAVLGHLEIDPATVDPSADFLADPTVPTDELVILGTRARRIIPVTGVQRIDSREVLGSGDADPGLVPSSFVTLDGLRRRGWKQIPAGWLVESRQPLTSEQIAGARDLAAEAGLAIETQREGSSFAGPIAIATAAGAVLALAILAMTIGLIRGESTGDLRTLTAAGATARIRRTLTAATAGALALLGALLGVTAAYLANAAIYVHDLEYLTRIPVLPLVLIVGGIPLAAAAGGWLLAGREPPAIARAAIE